MCCRHLENDLDNKNGTILSIDVFPGKPAIILFAEYQIWKSLIYEPSWNNLGFSTGAHYFGPTRMHPTQNHFPDLTWYIPHLFISLIVSGRYPENPAIWLVPGAGSIFLSPDHGNGGKQRGWNCHVRLVFVNELAVIVDVFPFYTSMDD